MPQCCLAILAGILMMRHEKLEYPSFRQPRGAMRYYLGSTDPVIGRHKNFKTRFIRCVQDMSRSEEVS